MHIVLVSSQHHPTHGGIGTYIRHYVEACTANGWRVELITRSGAEELLPRAHRVHCVVTEDMDPSFEHRVSGLRRIERIRPYRYGLWSLAVAEQLLSVEGQPDVIEFVDCQAEGFVSLTSQHVRDRFAEAAFVISAHTPLWINERYPGADPDRFGRPIYHAWERTALQAADGVIVPSRGLRDRLNLETPALVSCLPMTESPASAAMGSQMILLIGSVQPPKTTV
jgi:hypothetical protein